MDLGALLGQIRVIPIGSDSIIDVNIHMFGVICVGIVTLYVFLVVESIEVQFLSYPWHREL